MVQFARFSHPWRPFNDLQNDVNRLLAELAPHQFSRRGEYPLVNLWESEESFALTAEVPGLDVADLEITVNGTLVTLASDQQPQEQNAGDSVRRKERGAVSFSRTIELPSQADAEGAEAVFEKGVLTIRLSKHADDKLRRVVVQAR